MARSTWGGVVCETDRDRDVLKSWFPALCEDLTPYKAEVLEDNETGREKKLRMFAVDAHGKHFKLERTRGKTFVLSRVAIDAPKGFSL